jgi:hypothetical protein
MNGVWCALVVSLRQGNFGGSRAGSGQIAEADVWPLNYKLAIESDDAYLRVTAAKGTYGLGRTRRLIYAVRELCDRRQLRRVLIDLSRVTGIPPDIDRFELGERLAQAFGSTHAVAIIGRKESVNRLAETVALNRGAVLRVFFTEQEALSWLLSAANIKVASDE